MFSALQLLFYFANIWLTGETTTLMNVSTAGWDSKAIVVNKF